ncbi:alpha/beta fold hydrolase [Leifsonia sp. fls2-241-R2A-40a]|uniref:alpha/beta hydrolase n=1 Tax=Leifsonia sp. fls2-241-R2A-40a TaxID=3040290 RepID=UPI00254E0F71|nr:alpha/beta fold hydrolase [Leifsonia sp. fls2-241-R2A-40a]
MDPLSIRIVDGPVLPTFLVLSGAAVLYLLLRRPTTRWVITALLGILGGAVVAVGVYALLNAVDAFGSPLPSEVAFWAMGMFAAIGLAVVNLWRSRWWRKLVAAVGILLFAITGGLGINAYYGLDPTLGSLFGYTDAGSIRIGQHTSTADPAGPLYETWKPPADLPAKGQQGSQVIPSAGFAARPAGIYLPPAALVKNPPPLPVVLFMMGYPGNPDPSYIGGVLDTFAAAHEGLAPIAVVADQIGTQGDPACADSRTFGTAETYITDEVPAWIRSHLNVLQDPKYWTIGGYSNGGACAFKYAAQYPDRFGSLLVVSGDEYPGVEIQQQTIDQVFGGDAAAFERAKPTSILAANPGRYSAMTAVFTVGGNDPTFVPGVQRDAAAAQAAGMQTTFSVVPGAGHVVDALDGGLTKDFDILYPVLGLSPP